MAHIEILADANQVAKWAAAALVSDVAIAVRLHGVAVWVAAGGTTPTAAYKILSVRYADKAPWERVKVFMGDERCVLVDHPDSNWGQFVGSLANKLPFVAQNLVAPKGNLVAEVAAADYEEALYRLERLPSGRPRLDHVWIGMGEDGHTLSLFPGHPAADEQRHLVVPVHNAPKPPPDRISLTFGALEGAQRCLIMVAGGGKKEAVRRALAGDTSLPVARAARVIEAAGGNVVWVLDESAAELVA